MTLLLMPKCATSLLVWCLGTAAPAVAIFNCGLSRGCALANVHIYAVQHQIRLLLREMLELLEYTVSHQSVTQYMMM